MATGCWPSGCRSDRSLPCREDSSDDCPSNRRPRGTDPARGPARCLGSPVHTHRNEDEWTYVLEGEIGVELGSETHTAQPGDLILKPRNVPHAFWNGTDEPARLLEIITPGGFEGYFERLGDLLAGGGPPDLAAVAELASEYALEMQPDSIGRLAQAHRLHLPG